MPEKAISSPSSMTSMTKGFDATYFLDERRRIALEKLDTAKFSWFHAKVCFVAGVGFFTDAYDLFAINIASTMLGYVYGKHQTLTPKQDLGVKVAAPVGTLFGQLFFGWLADIVGRKRMYGVELMIIICATFAQALSGGAHAVSIVGVLCVWRFIMGIGVGGDYPLSATITSEFAPLRARGRMMTAVFASQGWGNFTAVLVGFIVTVAYKNAIIHDPDITQLNHVDYVWRLVIGMGCVPGVIGLYFRLTIPETPRFTMDIERNVLQAAADIERVLANGRFIPPESVQRMDAPYAPYASTEDFSAYFGRWENMKVLIGTAYSWFALDIAFYGLGLNNSIILQAIGFSTSSNKGTEGVYDNLHNICVGNLITSVAGLIPGYWVSFLFIDSWGRKPIQLMGFIVLTLLFVTIGFGYDKLVGSSSGRAVFVFLYCLTNFFQNFGPNTTTFIIPGEIFPTRYRATAHGLSAASGKLGAIIAQVGFSQLVNIGGTNKFVKHILQILAFFMLTGVFSTLLLPETRQRSLEKLSNEKQEGFLLGGTTTRIEVGTTTHVEVHDEIVAAKRAPV